MKATALFIYKKACSWNSLCIKEDWERKQYMFIRPTIFWALSYTETQDPIPTHLYSCCFASPKSISLFYLVYLKGKK